MFDADDEDLINQNNHDYMEILREFYEGDYIEMEESGYTPRQLMNKRNQWEKTFHKAKSLVFSCQNNKWGLKLVHVSNIQFEI